MKIKPLTESQIERLLDPTPGIAAGMVLRVDEESVLSQEDLLIHIAELESDNIRLRRMLKDFVEEPLRRILGYD